jgi:rRNA-processing protein FCF1
VEEVKRERERREGALLENLYTMRHGRAKAARRTLQFFHRAHGYSPPYHVALDGNLVVESVRFKIPLKERLQGLLQRAAFQLHVLESTMEELKSLRRAASSGGKPDKATLFDDAIRWLEENVTIVALEEKHRKVDKNGNDPSEAASGASRDLFLLVREGSATSGSPADTDWSDGTVQPSSPRRYILASQDEGLLDRVRKLGGVPVVRIAQHSVVLLEQPSKAAQRLAHKRDRRKWSGSEAVTDAERQLANLVRDHHRSHGGSGSNRQLNADVAASSGNTYQKRRQRKAKGPNPLSCRKKKQSGDEIKDSDGGVSQSERPAKRRRRNK